MDQASVGGSRASRLSVVIPSFDSLPWLPSTLAALDAAIAKCGWHCEVIVVDDGSSDGTADELSKIELRAPFRVVRQENQGRFMARWNGAGEARGDLVLFIDSRVLIDVGSLAHVESVMRGDASASTWNGHIRIDPHAALVGHFWDVPTRLFWWRYMQNPMPTVLSEENFDRLPKGTTMFLVERDRFLRAARAVWPVGDARLVSDDTRLIRELVQSTPIRLDPGFSAVYRPRESVVAFLRHAANRGSLFVDSYASTSRARDAVLVALGIGPPLSVIAVGVLVGIGQWSVAVAVAITALVSVATPALIGALRKAGHRAVVSYLAYAIPFSAVFWWGLLRGLMSRHTTQRRRSTP